VSEGEPARPWLRLTLAALVFGVASAATFAPILREGPERVVAVRPADGGFAITRAADAAYQAWLVARHA
jgi:hypothetical protein